MINKTVYIYDQKYKKEDFCEIYGKDSKDSSFLKNLLKIKVLVNDGIDGNEAIDLFETVKENKIKSNFVGVLYYTYDDCEYKIVSLPNYLSAGTKISPQIYCEENKIPEELLKHEKTLLKIFDKYGKELSARDELFSYSTLFCKHVIIAEKLQTIYKEYGPYTRKYKKNQSKRGRISWSATVKKKTPAIIDNVPIYTSFVYQDTESRETEITKIERSIISVLPDKQDFQDAEIYSEKELEDQIEYFKNLINNEMNLVFDDVKLHRLGLIRDYLMSQIGYSEYKHYDDVKEDLPYEEVKKIEGKCERKCVLKDVTLLKYSPPKNHRGFVNCYCTFVKDNITFWIKYNSTKEFDAKIGNIYTISLKEYKGTQFYSIEKTGSDSITVSTNESFNIYAIAKFSYVFEVLLAKYFADDRRGIRVERNDKIKAKYRSHLLGSEIDDMNAEKYKPYSFKMCDANKYSEINNHSKDIFRHTNFIDVAYDDTYNNGTNNYCMIIDAKHYSGECEEEETNNKFVQNLPDKESILKQFYYENIMKRIYTEGFKEDEKIKEKIEKIELLNTFVLPIHKEKENHNGCEDVFEYYGRIDDDLRKRRIYIVRADMDELIKGCFERKGNYQQRRDKLFELLANIKTDRNYKHVITFTGKFRMKLRRSINDLRKNV